MLETCQLEEKDELVGRVARMRITYKKYIILSSDTPVTALWMLICILSPLDIEEYGYFIVPVATHASTLFSTMFIPASARLAP